MTVCASPNASEAPNPVIVWNVVAPLMVAVSAAVAGPAWATSAPPASASTLAREAASNRVRRKTWGLCGDEPRDLRNAEKWCPAGGPPRPHRTGYGVQAVPLTANDAGAALLLE